MPGHLIRRLQQVAVKLFFARVGLEMTPGPVRGSRRACAAAEHGPGTLERAHRLRTGPRIGGVVGRLESRGWVTRSASRADRRVRLVRITPVRQEGARADAAGGHDGAAAFVGVARCRRARALRAPVPENVSRITSAREPRGFNSLNGPEGKLRATPGAAPRSVGGIYIRPSRYSIRPREPCAYH